MILGGVLAQEVRSLLCSCWYATPHCVLTWYLVSWQAGLESATPFVFFPVIIHAFDVLVSSIAIMLVGRGSEGEPMAMLMRGYFVSLVLAAIGFLFATWWLLSSDKYPGAWFNFFGCGVVGMITAYVFARSSQYYTDYAYEPVRTARWAVGMGRASSCVWGFVVQVQSIAKASTTGHGTNIITGVAVGMKSTFVPVIAVSIAVVTSYVRPQLPACPRHPSCNSHYPPCVCVSLCLSVCLSVVHDAQHLGRTSGMGSGHNAGLFGTAVATMGMLSSAAFVLSMNNYGPIADNAGGIAEMSQQSPAVRDATDRLDAAGNVTKAMTYVHHRGVTSAWVGCAADALCVTCVGIVRPAARDTPSAALRWHASCSSARCWTSSRSSPA